MIVVMQADASEAELTDVVAALAAVGCRVTRHEGPSTTLAAAGGAADRERLVDMPGVAAVRDDAAAPHATAGARAASTSRATAGVFEIAGRPIGGDAFFVAAGPCSVEDPETMDIVAREVRAAGAVALRAGAWKPRSSPYSFPGFGEAGLIALRRAADAHGLLVVSEVMDATQLAIAVRYCDILQVGARNMYNTPLLRELGRARKPVLLKRGLSATIDEWVQAAEYVASSGNPRVIFCERGIRTFEPATRNTLDLNAVPLVRARTGLPVLVDPSHGIGLREHVPALARAAAAVGADGLLVEVHVRPDDALSDASQTIDTATFARMMRDVAALRGALARG